jgi:putative transposase
VVSTVSDETIRAWCERFGQQYAHQLRHRGPRPGDKGHLDEVFVQISGAQRDLWRAVDQHGTVLDILVQPRRTAVAAKKFFRRLRTGLRCVPRVIVTDKLASTRWRTASSWRRCRIAGRSTCSTAPRTLTSRPGTASGR